MVFSVDRGTVYDQSELDSLSESDIRSTIEFVDSDIQLTHTHLFLNYGFHTIEQRTVRDYIVERKVMTVSFTIQEVLDCVSESSLPLCVIDLINPRINGKAVGLREQRTTEIMRLQSRNTFDARVLSGIVTAGELN